MRSIISLHKVDLLELSKHPVYSFQISPQGFPQLRSLSEGGSSRLHTSRLFTNLLVTWHSLALILRANIWHRHKGTDMQFWQVVTRQKSNHAPCCFLPVFEWHPVFYSMTGHLPIHFYNNISIHADWRKNSAVIKNFKVTVIKFWPSINYKIIKHFNITICKM